MNDVNALAVNIFLFFGILLLIIVLVGFFFKRYLERAKLRYYRKAWLLTQAELRFYKLLKKMLIRDFDVLAQVRLANLVELNTTFFNWNLFQPIGAKCVDFVICDKQTMDTLLVIELDDRSHERFERIRRDIFVDQVLAIAKIPILHVPTQQYYSLEQLNQAIREKMGGVKV